MRLGRPRNHSERFDNKKNNTTKNFLFSFCPFKHTILITGHENVTPPFIIHHSQTLPRISLDASQAQYSTKSHKIVGLTNNLLSCSVHGPSLHFLHLNNVISKGKYSKVSNSGCFNPSYSSRLSCSTQLHAAMLPTFVASVIRFRQSLVTYFQRVSAHKYIMESENRNQSRSVEYRCKNTLWSAAVSKWKCRLQPNTSTIVLSWTRF